jgi:hypothetical protein
VGRGLGRVCMKQMMSLACAAMTGMTPNHRHPGEKLLIPGISQMFRV